MSRFQAPGFSCFAGSDFHVLQLPAVTSTSATGTFTVGSRTGCSGLLTSDTKIQMAQLYSVALHLYIVLVSSAGDKAGLSPANRGAGGQLALFPCCFPVLKAICG